MAHARGPFIVLFGLVAIFVADAVVFWLDWISASSPASYQGLHLMFGAMNLLALVLLGGAIVASVRTVLRRHAARGLRTSAARVKSATSTRS